MTRWASAFCEGEASDVKKKLFISHASEDKDDFVRPLAKALSVNFDVWYDELKLRVGCSLLEEINKGLTDSDYGVVVLSNHFFAKNWPQQELNGLFALEEKDKKVILPVWKGVSKEDVMGYSPILADRVAAKAEDGVPKVVDDIKKAVAFFERGRAVENPSRGLSKLRSSIEKKTERERSERIVWSEAGVSIALNAAKQTIDSLADNVRLLCEDASTARIRLEGPKEDAFGYRVHVWIGRTCLEACYMNTVANSAMDARLEFVIFQTDPDSRSRNSRPKVYGREKYSLYVDISDNKLWKSEKDQLFKPEEAVDKWLDKLAARIERQ